MGSLNMGGSVEEVLLLSTIITIIVVKWQQHKLP